MSSHLEKADDIFPRPFILFCFFDFIQCLNHNAILWFSSISGFNHTPRCSVHAPHLLCFSQTDAMVLLSFHTRSLTQTNSRPLGKFKTGQGTMSHASQRKKHLNMAHQVKPSLKHWADPWKRSVEYSQRIKNVPTNSTKRDTNVKFKNKQQRHRLPTAHCEVKKSAFGRSGR